MFSNSKGKITKVIKNKKNFERFYLSLKFNLKTKQQNIYLNY